MAKVQQPEIDATTEEWLVFGDALQEEGDPRGELIALYHAGDLSAVQRFVKEHAEALFGDVADNLELFEFTWKWCLLDGVDIRIGPKDDGAALVEALFQTSVASGLERIALIGVTSSSTDEVDLSGAIARLVDALPKRCTHLELIDQRAAESTSLTATYYDPGQNLVRFGPLESLWRTPIERLHITTADSHQLELGTLNAPNLKSFELLSLCWASYDGPTDIGTVLAKATWPNLTSLRLRLPETWTCSVPDEDGAYVEVYGDYEGEYYGGDDGYNDGVNWGEDLGPVLASLAKTKIEHLALMSFDSSESLLETISEHGLPNTLRELDLSDSSLSSTQVEWFVQHKEMISRLEQLNLSGTLMSQSDAAKIGRLGPKITHSTGGGAAYRFLVGME